MADETHVTVYKYKGDPSDLLSAQKDLQKSFSALERQVAKLKKEQTEEAKAAAAAAKAKREAAKSAAQATRQFAALSAVALGASKALWSMAQRGADARNALADLSGQTAISARTLGALSIAATRSGKDLNVVAAGLKGFSKRMNDAARGTGEAKVAFDELGISARDKVSGQLRDADDVFVELIGKLQGLESITKRNALATHAFGESGVILMQQLGDKSLTEFINEFDRFGTSVSPVALENASRWQTVVANQKAVLDRAGGALLDYAAIGNRVLEPAILGMTDAVLDFEEGLRGNIYTLFGIKAAIKAAEEATADSKEEFEDWNEIVAEAARVAREHDKSLREIASAQAQAEALARSHAAALRQLQDASESARISQLDGAAKVIAELEREERRLEELYETTAKTAADEQALREAKLEAARAAAQELRAIEAEAADERMAKREEDAQHAADLAERMDADVKRVSDGLQRQLDERRAAARTAVTDTIGALGAISKATMGLAEEGTAAHTALFAIQQGAAAASVIVNTQAAIMSALAEMPYPAGEIAAAARAVTGAAALAAIGAATFGGGGGGGDSVQRSKSLGPRPGSTPSGASHGGSIAPDERIVRVLANQGVVNAPVVEQMGGHEAVRRTNEAAARPGGLARRRDDGAQAFYVGPRLVDFIARNPARTPGSTMYRIRRDGRRVGHSRRNAPPPKVVT